MVTIDKPLFRSAAVKAALARTTPFKTRVAYYYFDFRDSKKKLTRSMLCSLTHQLISSSPTLSCQMLDLKEKYSKPDLIPWSDMVHNFTRCCMEYNATTLIIDALDECDDFTQLVKFLRGIVQSATSSADIRIACFSRDEVNIKRCLGDLNFSPRPLEKDSIAQDIAMYVRAEVEDDPTGKFNKFNETLKRKIIRALNRRSSGM